MRDWSSDVCSSDLEVPKNVVMDIETVTEDNVEQYYREDMPDSFWVLTELNDEALGKLYK